MMSKSPTSGARALVYALGCKVNQAECAAVERALAQEGFEIGLASTPPDLIVVNTCCVTGRAEGKSRRAALSLAERFPHADCIVIGCLAAFKPESLAGKAKNVRVVPAGNADNVAALIAALDHPGPDCADNGPLGGCAGTQARPYIGRYAGRARALLKVQDGCSQRCSYCIVPHARGMSRSVPLKQAVAAAQKLEDQGHAEIVLTGVHLGMYGRDLAKPLSLAALLESLLRSCRRARFRLSSIEPQEFSQDLINLAAGHPDVCRHVHIPLQSGADAILAKMGRPYRADTIRALTEKLRSACHDVCLGMDVMTGFPGEDDASFQKTVQLIEEISPAYLHVFPFSPRPGTPAATFAPLISQRATAARADLLREISNHFRGLYYARFVGKPLEVVPESLIAAGLPTLRTRSDNYLAVNVGGRPAPASAGRFWVRLRQVSDGEAYGTPVITP